MRRQHSRKSSGAQAESIAARHIAGHGLKIIDKNFHCRFGEIDLVAIDGNTTPVIEWIKNAFQA